MHFSLLSGQEYTAPGMFIANTIDDEPASMPIAPMTAPAPGREHRCHPSTMDRVLDQSVGTDERHLHGHQRPQWLHQDLHCGSKIAIKGVPFSPSASRIDIKYMEKISEISTHIFFEARAKVFCDTA